MPARMQRIRKRTARIKSRAIRLADNVRTDNERKLLETENNSAKPSPYAQQPKSAFDTKNLQSSVDSLFSSFKRLTSSDGMGKSTKRRRRPLVNNAYPAATVSTSSLTSENISRFSSKSDSSMTSSTLSSVYSQYSLGSRQISSGISNSGVSLAGVSRSYVPRTGVPGAGVSQLDDSNLDVSNSGAVQDSGHVVSGNICVSNNVAGTIQNRNVDRIQSSDRLYGDICSSGNTSQICELVHTDSNSGIVSTNNDTSSTESVVCTRFAPLKRLASQNTVPSDALLYGEVAEQDPGIIKQQSPTDRPNAQHHELSSPVPSHYSRSDSRILFQPEAQVAEKPATDSILNRP
eukprot:983129_1